MMGSSHLSVVSRQTNVLLLGFFLSPSDAALFTTAILIAPAIQVFYGAVRFIFLPVASRLAGENNVEDFNKLYATVTKWVTTFTLPIAAVVMVLPEPIITVLFGEQYRPAALTMQLVLLGYFFSVWVGPNTGALMALGYSGRVFWGVSIANVSAIVLSIALIPLVGIIGAALASMASMLISNIYLSYSLYRASATTPLSRGSIVATLATGVVVALLLPFSSQLSAFPTLVVVPVIGLLFVAVSFVGTWLLGGIDEEDQRMWQMVREPIRARIGR